MRQGSAKVWVGGTAFVAVLILVAAWFLLLDPVMARASEDRAQESLQAEQNALLELEIAKLKEQFTHLDEYEAELASLQAQMPVDSDASGLTRELQGLADAAGVTITSLQPSVPQLFVLPASAAEATSVVADGATEEAPVDGTAADGATADPAASAVANFYQVPITVTSLGNYEASVAFLRSVQEGASRLYLVSSITATTQEDEGATAGKPATVKGDIELRLTGYAFVLVDGATPTDPAAEPAPLPVPGGEVNPFQPGR